MFSCVVCGHHTSKRLYENYGGSLQLSQCDSCHGTIDKYIECENIIIFLDLFLHRLGVLRHLLFNTSIKLMHHVAAVTLVLLCAAYFKLLSFEPVAHLDWLEKQPFFYTFFLQSVIEFGVSVLMFFAVVSLWCGHQSIRSFSLAWKCVLLPNCAMLYVIPAMVWYHSWKGIYLQVPWLLVATSQIQIFRAALQVSIFWSLLLVLLSQSVVGAVHWLLTTVFFHH